MILIYQLIFKQNFIKSSYFKDKHTKSNSTNNLSKSSDANIDTIEEKHHELIAKSELSIEKIGLKVKHKNKLDENVIYFLDFFKYFNFINRSDQH